MPHRGVRGARVIRRPNGLGPRRRPAADDPPPQGVNDPRKGRHRCGLIMDDILADLTRWLAQVHADAPHRPGRLPEIHIDLVVRAIAEIERLRALCEPRGR